MNIPSNYTLEEVIKYCNLPEEVVVRLEDMMDKMQILEKQVKQADRIEERLREQVQFRDNYIEEVMDVFSKAKSKQELVEAKKYAGIALENSYIELSNEWGVL